MYKVRKGKSWFSYQFSWFILCFHTLFTICFGTAFIFILLTILGIIEWGNENSWIWLPILSIPVSILCFIEIKMLKIYFSKKLKYNWIWTIKKIKISSIEKIIHHWKTIRKTIRANQETFQWYFLQANEWENIYCSDWIKKNDVQDVLLTPDFPKLYQNYWYEYDINEIHKKEVLHEINKDINELKDKVDNWWIFEKISAKKELSTLEENKKIVEQWYQPPYIIVNWHKISVWDTVDVYIDPNNEKNYWMDIDFLFE